jgi:uncharacterized protein (DUF1684 family)
MAGRASDLLDLMEWKRAVFGLYAEVRAAGDHPQAWRRWREGRDDLFARHAQSPLPPGRRQAFAGLPYFGHDPAARVLAKVVPTEPEHYEIATSGEAEGSYGFTRFARAEFEYREAALALELYWLDGYGGGIFVPFRDATSGTETYGAGRYVLDTVKGADLGVAEDGRLVLDFNYSYNPSCAYDPRWVCPLAPMPNRLTVRIEAGERYAPRPA